MTFFLFVLEVLDFKWYNFNMNKLIPFSKVAKLTGNLISLSNASVVVDNKKTPLGFFFGRDTFISLMTIIDQQFEEKVSDQKKAYDNYAGKIIDLIEQKLEVRKEFVKDLKDSIVKAKKEGWLPIQKIQKLANV